MNTAALVQSLHDAGQDFEWYPTTQRMVERIIAHIDDDRPASFMDIGAGDGRVLNWFAAKFEHATLFGIEKSDVLRQAQPKAVAPVGTEFFEQDLMSLPVDVLFCNPPYSEFEQWAARIIETGHADSAYLVLPQRWESSDLIQIALLKRGATAKVIHKDDFLDAERRARAVIHIVHVDFRGGERFEGRFYRRQRPDPFDAWFDQNIGTFDEAPEITDYQQEQKDLARLHSLETIDGLATAYNEDYDRMQRNYQAIFQLDHAILKELGVNKDGIREGLKKRMAGLKNTYWSALFEHLDAITSRLTTRTKAHFRDRVTKNTSVAFTYANAYAVTMWAVKFANLYFDRQLVELFRELSTREGVSNYKSNQRTWEQDGWRYNHREREYKNSHYALDYRVVLPHSVAIFDREWGDYDYPGHLHNSAHELIDDVIAVFGNLGFLTRGTLPSRSRVWHSNTAQAFVQLNGDGETLFEVKAFKNGNLHFKFRPEAIKALNIEAGRLLGWIRSCDEAVAELGCTAAEAERYFGSNQQLVPGAVKLLSAGREFPAVSR